MLYHLNKNGDDYIYPARSTSNQHIILPKGIAYMPLRPSRVSGVHYACAQNFEVSRGTSSVIAPASVVAWDPLGYPKRIHGHFCVAYYRNPRVMTAAYVGVVAVERRLGRKYPTCRLVSHCADVRSTADEDGTQYHEDGCRRVGTSRGAGSPRLSACDRFALIVLVVSFALAARLPLFYTSTFDTLVIIPVDLVTVEPSEIPHHCHDQEELEAAPSRRPASTGGGRGSSSVGREPWRSRPAHHLDKYAKPKKKACPHVHVTRF